MFSRRFRLVNDIMTVLKRVGVFGEDETFS